MASADRTNENHAIHGVGEQRSIGHGQQRRNVNDHDELFGELVNQLAHLIRAQKFGGVRGDTACRQDEEVRIAQLVHSVSNLNLAGQNLGQTNLSVQLQLLSHGRAAEVGVNEDDGRTRISHCASQRQRHGRLTFTGHCGGDDERTRGSVNIHEAQVGSQLTDGFLSDVVVGVTLNDVVFVQVVTDGQNTQDVRAGCLGRVVTGADALIQRTAQEDCQVNQSQTNSSTQKNVLLVVRSHQRGVHACVIQRNHADSVAAGRGCTGVFAVYQSLSVTGVLLNFLDVVGGSLQRTVSENLCILRGRSLRVHGNQCSVVTSGCGEARTNLTGA